MYVSSYFHPKNSERDSVAATAPLLWKSKDVPCMLKAQRDDISEGGGSVSMSSTEISLATAEDFHKGMVAYQAEKVDWGEIPEGLLIPEDEILACVFGQDGATKCLWALLS